MLTFAALLGSLLVPATSAHAASTVLCSGYTSCAEKGYPHAGYATAKSKSYWNMYTGTNCTNYVAYRMITTNGMSTTRPKPGVGNARDWGTAMASVTDKVPAVGAVAWWGRTGNHVAYIEKVVSANEIWVSESNWSGAFDWRRITRAGGGWPDGIIHFTPAAPATSSKPALVGETKVGTAVKASVGIWNPTPSSYAYQWLVDGVAIAGATAKTFTPTSSILGRALSVRVSGARSGSPTVTVVSSAATVAPGTLTVVTRPVLGGTPKVGSRLTTTAGTWSRKDVTQTYQWYSGATPVEGATSSSYVARSVDAGSAITARVTAVRVGYTSAPVATASSSAVVPGTLVQRSAPAVTGTPRVGDRLTADPGTWSPRATVSYQWYAGGTAVAGATDQTFTPSARERSKTVRVRVVARRAGYTTSSATSAETTVVGAGRFAVTTAPSITGSATRGSRLTVSSGEIAPTTASVTYQWLRDGKAVAGATGRTRTVSQNDVGRRLSAVVTYKASGYSALSVTTGAAKKARATAKITVRTTSSTGGKVAFALTVRTAGGTPLSGSVTVTRGDAKARTVKVVRGKATFALTRQPAGRQTYRLTFGGSTGIASSSRDKSVTVR